MNKNNEVFDFGLRLKRLRKDKKMSQEELAKRLGVSKGTIYRYESNTQTVSFDSAIKLAMILGTSLEYLAGLESGTIIRFPRMTDEQETIFREFVRVFFENDK